MRLGILSEGRSIMNSTQRLTEGAQSEDEKLASNSTSTPPLPKVVLSPTATQNRQMSETPNLQGADRAPPSVIGPDLVITGNLTSKGQMQIDGEIQGDVHGSHVIIGQRARVTGGIRAQEVVVRGQVMGTVHGQRVILQANSHVEGDIFHKALAIEQGAYFEGKSRRSDDPVAEPLSDQSKPSPAPISLLAKVK